MASIYLQGDTSTMALLVLTYHPSIMDNLPPHLLTEPSYLVLAFTSDSHVYRQLYADVIHLWKDNQLPSFPPFETVTGWLNFCGNGKLFTKRTFKPLWLVWYLNIDKSFLLKWDFCGFNPHKGKICNINSNDKSLILFSLTINFQCEIHSNHELTVEFHDISNCTMY